MQLPLVDTKTESTKLETRMDMTTTTPRNELCRNSRLGTTIDTKNSKSLDEGPSRTKNYNTTLAIAKMITNNHNQSNHSRSCNSSIIDDGSECSDHARESDLNGIDEYNIDFDGDSITDYDGTDLDVESQSQHQRQDKMLLPPPSHEAPMTHHVEFDHLALGRESSHKNSKASAEEEEEEEQSSSGKNSVLTFSEKTSSENSKKKKSNISSNSRVKTIVKSETKRIRRWKLASIAVVAAVGLASSIFLFWDVYQKEVVSNLDTTPDIGDDQLFYKAVFNFEDAANKYVRQSVRVLEEISRALTERANRNTTQITQPNGETYPSFPFITLPNFSEMARELSDVGVTGDAENETNHFGKNLFERVFWAPIISEPSKDDWGKYSYYHQGWIMDTGLKEQHEGVLDEHEDDEGDNLVDAQTPATVWLKQDDEEYPNPEDMPEEAKIRPWIHTDLLHDGDYSKDEAPTEKYAMTTRFQFSSDSNAQKTMQYLPAWQTFDFDHDESIVSHDHSRRHRRLEDELATEELKLATDKSFVNFDLFSWFSQNSAAIKDVRSILEDDDDSIGENILDGNVHVWNDPPFDDTNHCHNHTDLEHSECDTTLFLRVPIYDNLQTQNVVGYVFAVLNEEIGFFSESAILSGSENLPLRLVVKEDKNGRPSSTRKRTYEIRGPEIIFIGNGDLHDEKYDDKVYKFKLKMQSEESTSATQYSLYPTEDFFRYATAKKEEVYMSFNDRYPWINALWSASLVASVFAVILIMFVCYDNSVEDRQRKLLRQAERTDAIVGSMFPANIQGRLMMIDDDTIESSQRQRGAERKRAVQPLLSGFNASTHSALAPADVDKASAQINDSSFHTSNDPNSSKPAPLLTRMGRKHTPGNELRAAPVDESILRFGNTKPMADFYPNTTILMCDIAGFTAWSSARAPADVFRLLETIYGAFDDIARAEKVFKVETVGDCYVACAGLPVKQPKHAVIMAKFAKKVLKRYDTLIKKLETYLGPDTVDLGLRIGIHSGPVTAGVLRGDKTRFQLFGDTVNTASRMESTGRVNRIQISPQTAKLLKDEGLGKWVLPRQNLVSVKGKGKMQTFWLLRSGSSTMSQPSLSSPVGSSKLAKGNSIWKVHGQRRRSSMGASNASWETSSTGTQSSGSVQSHPQRRHSNENSARNSKERRIIEWMVETFMKSLKKIATHRARNPTPYQSEEFLDGKEFSLSGFDPEAQIIEEIKEVIPIRQKESRSSNASKVSLEASAVFDGQIQVSRAVERQLRDYITVVSLLYHDHAFHNFEHCAHVLMSVLKLLSRILESKQSSSDGGLSDNYKDDDAYGITSDPLLEFSCLFSALIHDVDHSGVPNSQLVKEHSTTAVRYKDRSVAEQHSIAVAWSLLMQPCYRELRESIYGTQTEFDRFRQLVVNSVMATDIMDRELKKFRDKRWEKAFDLRNDIGIIGQCTENCNRMATVVIEHMIQASDVAHTMQHWHVYLKFNERLFKEMYQAYKDGRAEKDPSEYWYEGELNFFKFYIIPLALKLKECGAFGVSGDEYFFHAESNRTEWALKGKEIVEGYMGRASRDSSRNSSRSSSPSPMIPHQLLELPEGKESSFTESSLV